MNKVHLILVGGFLGAGKTTLLWQAAQRLISRGRHVGLITNDQAPDLVDTTLLMKRGLDVREVAGSCFCCNFDGLIQSAEQLCNDVQVDVLVGEPVGSCTDLSATIMQPLKANYHNRFSLAPLTVLADPHRLETLLSGNPGLLHPSAGYIYMKQLEEADVIAINKSDLLTHEDRKRIENLLADRLPGRSCLWLSAQEGDGVDAWIDAMQQAGPVGNHILDIDYDTYAEGEAVLGWLNAALELKSISGRTGDWKTFARRLLDELHGQFRTLKAEVGHVKLILSDRQSELVGNLTRLDAAPKLRGECPPSLSASMILNARVEMPPATLEQRVRRVMQEICGTTIEHRFLEMRCLSPGRPQPTFRHLQVVNS